MTTEQLKIGVVLKTATGSTNMYKISFSVRYCLRKKGSVFIVVRVIYVSRFHLDRSIKILGSFYLQQIFLQFKHQFSTKIKDKPSWLVARTSLS